MGYGLPAAIGAQFAAPGRLVVNVSGDGSFQMNIQELATVVFYKLPIKVIILNNSSLGLVKQFQKLSFGGRYASTDVKYNPNFAKIAESFGAQGFRVDKKNEVLPTLQKTLANDKPVVIEFVVDKDEDVLPMLLGGKPIEEQFPYLEVSSRKQEVRSER